MYTQDDQRVQYLQDQLEVEAARLLREESREPRYSSSNKKRSKPHQQQQQHYISRDKSPSDYPSSHYTSGREREYLVSTGESKHFLQQTDTHKASDPIPAIEEVGRYLEQAEARAKSVKELAKELATEKSIHTTDLRQDKPQEQTLQADQDLLQQLPPPEEAQSQLLEQIGIDEPPPSEPKAPPAVSMDATLQTFRPQPQAQPQIQLSGTMGRTLDRQAEVHLQQEQIQYVDNECCQVAVTTNPTMDSATIKKTTAGGRAKTDTMKSQAHQVGNF